MRDLWGGRDRRRDGAVARVTGARGDGAYLDHAPLLLAGVIVYYCYFLVCRAVVPVMRHARKFGYLYDGGSYGACEDVQRAPTR